MATNSLQAVKFRIHYIASSFVMFVSNVPPVKKQASSILVLASIMASTADLILKKERKNNMDLPRI